MSVQREKERSERGREIRADERERERDQGQGERERGREIRERERGMMLAPPLRVLHSDSREGGDITRRT